MWNNLGSLQARPDTLSSRWSSRVKSMAVANLKRLPMLRSEAMSISWAEILRKAKLLNGTNIYVGEDFSKRVKDQRHELQKVNKTVISHLPSFFMAIKKTD